MEDLAASIMTLSRSAPLYLFFEVPALQKHHVDELPDGGGGFEFALAAGEKDVDEEEDNGGAPRACASDVSAYADELFRGGMLLPLKLPPRLQRLAAASSTSSAATSPTGHQLVGRTSSWSPFASRRRHRGFDPFVAALEKVRRDGAVAPAPRRARSLSPLRGAAAAATSARSSWSRPAGTAANGHKANASPPCRSTRRRGFKHYLCSAGAADRRRRVQGVPCRSRRLLVCFGL